VNVPENGQSCICPKNKIGNGTCKNNSNHFVEFDQLSGEEIANKMNRNRRSLEETAYNDDIIEHEERSFFLDDQDAHIAAQRVRAKRDVGDRMSKENATKYCKRVIEDSIAGKTCQKLLKTNLTVSMLSCITDLQVG
jgi:hypothetical protein